VPLRREKSQDEAVTRAIPLYDEDAAWMGGSMAEPAYATASGTEISGRSKDLVLPSEAVPEAQSVIAPPGRKTGLSDSSIPQTSQTEASLATPSSRHIGDSSPSDLGKSALQVDAETARARGVALPGDRGTRIQPSGEQRPSFWRRIALGTRREGQAKIVKADATAVDSTAIERRIVEPMLQALVSVEAKLERSHVDLIQRSDQVEQRLTQLWDIEEQLGALGELQESLLQVAEQQRRLEFSIETQTRTLRWLVGGVFFSLAAAAFVVAVLLR
jgi:hypothetical protein